MGTTIYKYMRSFWATESILDSKRRHTEDTWIMHVPKTTVVHKPYITDCVAGWHFVTGSFAGCIMVTYDPIFVLFTSGT
jgi:hypothetical protein